MASQEERKAETRRRLLDAAALLFAERGIDAVSIDTVADAADRTSGAVYAHFGGKDGLLVALLDELVDDMAAVMSAELTLSDDADEQLAGLWRTFSDPPPGPGRGWMLLEHEFWLYAARHGDAQQRLARRFELARASVAEAMAAYAEHGDAELPGAPRTGGHAARGDAHRPRDAEPHRSRRGARRHRRDRPAGRHRPAAHPTRAGVAAQAVATDARADPPSTADDHPDADDVVVGARERSPEPEEPSMKLDEIDLLAGTWEAGVPYEAFDRLRAERPGPLAPRARRARASGPSPATPTSWP